jgi:hypothetical protein
MSFLGVSRRSTAGLFAAVLWWTFSARAAWAQACESARPTDPGGGAGVNYGAAAVTSFDSPGGAARIWYALSGPHAPPSADSAAPPAVVAAARAADAALSKFQVLGFDPPH